jgi:hypothetical protein
MHEEILIAPVNRWLAAGTHSDMGLYGAPGSFNILPQQTGAVPVGNDENQPTSPLPMLPAHAAPPPIAGTAAAHTPVSAVLPAQAAMELVAPILLHPADPAPEAFIGTGSVRPATVEPVTAPSTQISQPDDAGAPAAPAAVAADGEPPADLQIGLPAIAPATVAEVGEFLGSDPAEGIATLISLVSTSDVFELRDVDLPAELLADATDPITAMVDSLAGIASDDPLFAESGDSPASTVSEALADIDETLAEAAPAPSALEQPADDVLHGLGL